MHTFINNHLKVIGDQIRKYRDELAFTEKSFKEYLQALREAEIWVYENERNINHLDGQNADAETLDAEGTEDWPEVDSDNERMLPRALKDYEPWIPDSLSEIQGRIREIETVVLWMQFAEIIKSYKFLSSRKIYEVVAPQGLFTNEMLVQVAMINRLPQYYISKVRGKNTCIHFLSYYGSRRQVCELLWRSSHRHRRMLVASQQIHLGKHTLICAGTLHAVRPVFNPQKLKEFSIIKNLINYLGIFFPSAATPFERKLFMPLKFLKPFIKQILTIAIVESG
jgi:hypothetical protein